MLDQAPAGQAMGGLYGRVPLAWFFKAVDSAFRQGADLPGALAAAQGTTTRYLECMARTNARDACIARAEAAS